MSRLSRLLAVVYANVKTSVFIPFLMKMVIVDGSTGEPDVTRLFTVLSGASACRHV